MRYEGGAVSKNTVMNLDGSYYGIQNSGSVVWSARYLAYNNNPKVSPLYLFYPHAWIVNNRYANVVTMKVC